MSDGSITFSTKLDNSDLESELKDLKGKIKAEGAELREKRKAEESAKKARDAAEAALERQREKEEQIRIELEKQEREREKIVDQIVNSESAIEAARKRAKEMDTQWLNGVSGADKDASGARVEAAALVSEHEKLVHTLEPYEKKVEKVTANLERQRAIVADVSDKHAKAAESLVVAGQAVASAEVSLNDTKDKAGEISTQLARASKNGSRLGDAISGADKNMDRFTRRLKTLVGRVFIFSMLTRAFRSLQSWMWESIRTNDDAVKAVARMKGALLTMVQPLVSVVIPAFTAFVNVLTNAITVVGRFVSLIFGTTLEASSDAAESLNNQKNALSGVGSAAKKAAKNLAAFDEINQISGEDGSSGGSMKSGAAIAPDFSFDEYKSKVSEFELFLSGALLALGAILTFTGANIPLGLGLMAVGAIGLATALKEEWDNIPTNVQNTISAILLAVAGAALAIGAVFLLTGHVGIGLGLIALGALSFWGASELGVSWSDVPKLLNENIDSVLLTLAGVALVFGVIFLLTGHIGLGLGLIATSALAFWGANEFGFNWDAVPPEVRQTVSSILMAISGAALVFGAVFLFTGHVGIGLGLIAIAALSFWGADKFGFDWGQVPSDVRGTISDILIAIGGAALVFGTVFLFTGNIALGLGLIAIGALAFWGGIKAGEDWSLVSGKVRDELKVMLGIIAGASLVIGTIFLLTGNVPLGLALIGLSVASFFGLTAVNSEENWGEIADKVGGGLDNVEKEIESHTDSIRSQSASVGSGMIDGTAEAVSAGEPVVSAAMGDTMEAGMTAAKDAVVDSKEDVVGAYKFVYNSVLDNTELFINRYLSSMRTMAQSASAIMSALPDTPAIRVPSFSPINVPRLARGAVIPPNREFMAVLGDQKSGTNLEAPERLIRQIVREESGRNGSTGGRPMTIILEVGKREFARLVYEANEDETQRVGVTLA